jgi:hypothetical protein
MACSDSIVEVGCSIIDLQIIVTGFFRGELVNVRVAWIVTG